MVRRARIGVTAVLAAVLAGAALTGCGWAQADGPPRPKASAKPAAVASTGADGVQTVTLTAGEDMAFSPNVIKAKTGKLRITLNVTGTTPHNLQLTASSKVPQPAPSTGMVQQGHAGTVLVNLPSAGRYDFVCTYHTNQGMTGYIQVS